MKLTALFELFLLYATLCYVDREKNATGSLIARLTWLVIYLQIKSSVKTVYGPHFVAHTHNGMFFFVRTESFLFRAAE